MWVKPDLVSVSALWSTERLNQWFVLQKRRGHGDGDQTLLGTTLKSMDSIMFNVLPWRILYIGVYSINLKDYLLYHSSGRIGITISDRCRMG